MMATAATGNNVLVKSDIKAEVVCAVVVVIFHRRCF